ncbi:hypothetical protein [Geminicoccus flavidas]|uniref:hypothetical protein n=1 Tax=Geminicoccus flavidas TaxID=2506407 RepID=UPI001359619C|nr:hypothetical protein [Geminicoccus flavidas]
MSGKRLSPEEWAAARAAWENEPALSITALAARIGVSKQSCADQAKRHGWEKRADLRELAIKAHAKADKVVPPKEAARQPDGQGLDPDPDANPDPDADAGKKPVTEHPDPVDARTEIIARHRQEWRAARVNLYTAINKKDFEMGKVAKITLEGLSILQKGERAAWGLDAIDPEKQAPVVVIERG